MFIVFCKTTDPYATGLQGGANRAVVTNGILYRSYFDDYSDCILDKLEVLL